MSRKISDYNEPIYVPFGGSTAGVQNAGMRDKVVEYGVTMWNLLCKAYCFIIRMQKTFSYTILLHRPQWNVR